MRKLKRSELEKGLDKMISNTLTVLEDLHVVHKDNKIEEIMHTKLPIGNLTLSKLLINIFEILRPVINLARKQYPQLFHIIDWFEAIVKKLLKS